MIKIITKDYCPYCELAKELISSIWLDYEEINVNNDPQRMQEIMEISWMMTVPQIFKSEIKKEDLLWWYSDIKELYDKWELLEKLK